MVELCICYNIIASSYYIIKWYVPQSGFSIFKYNTMHMHAFVDNVMTLLVLRL